MILTIVQVIAKYTPPIGVEKHADEFLSVWNKIITHFFNEDEGTVIGTVSSFLF